MDMEMADYERLVKELNAKLVHNDEYAEELKAQINTLTQKENTLKEEIGMCWMFGYKAVFSAYVQPFYISVLSAGIGLWFPRLFHTAS